MYPYVKIKDVIFLYKNRIHLKMGIDKILFIMQIARFIKTYIEKN